MNGKNFTAVNKFWMITCLLTLLIVSLSGCTLHFDLDGVKYQAVVGSGDAAQKTFNVSGFSAVTLNGIGDLVVELGDKESLTLETDENLLKYFSARVSGGALEINNQENTIVKPQTPVRFYLTVKELDTLAINGLGDISLPALETKTFRIMINGVGDVSIENLLADRLSIDIPGMGSVFIADGEIDRQEIVINGAGKYVAGGVKSADAEITVRGTGTVTIWVEDTLSIQSQGISNVNYFGDPKVETSGKGAQFTAQLPHFGQ